jgi:hypothetical protein
MSGYSEFELLKKPHNILRHPDMPKLIFKMLWDYIQKKQEIFAYVKNLTKDGSYYWVLANVTPSFDLDGNVIGYHSVRRSPDRNKIEIIDNLYKDLLSKESVGGVDASQKHLSSILKSKGVDYEQFIFTL